MTVTEAPRAAAPEAAPAPSMAPAPTGLAAVVGSGDPRTVGKLFIGTSLLFLLASGVAGTFASAQQATIDVTSASDLNGVARLTTMHATAGLFLGVLPLLLGLATAIVPLQIGAATVAFPRASAAAFWTWLTAGGIALASYALGGGPYAPGSEDTATSLYVAALGVVVIALTVATVSVVTTVLTLRAPGMSLRRTPLFSWSMLVAGSVWVLTLPVLGALLLLSYVDLNYGKQFLGGAGGLFNHIGWTLWQPTLYAFAVPALGIVADVVPVFARRRHQSHRGAMFLIGLYAALAFGAWAMPGFTLDGSDSPTPWANEFPWMVVGFLAVLPVLGLLALWTLTLVAGSPRLGTPLVLSLFAGFLLFAGTAAGAATGIDQLGLAGTSWMTAQSEVVLIGALVAALAGVSFWAPKLYGKLLPDGLMRLAATLLTLGALAAGVTLAIAGALDQNRFVTGGIASVASADVDTVEVLDQVAAAGLAVATFGGLLALGAMVARKRTGPEGPGDDPWDGHTLEWTTTSPPPVGNFASLPEITSEAPLYDARYGPGAVATASEGSA
jgi:cytochrome c oxidase subunit I